MKKKKPKEKIVAEKVKNTFTQQDFVDYCFWYKTTNFNCEGHSPEDCVKQWMRSHSIK